MNQIEIPAEVSAAGVSSWYASLNDPGRVKARRYLAGIDTSSPEAFMTDLMFRSADDHNYRFSAEIGDYALSKEMDPYTRFKVTEAYIEGLYGSERYEEAKKQCCLNLDLFVSVKEQFLADNSGKLPSRISCRNRLIDILVGVECAYDEAMALLDDYAEIGIMYPDELEYRRQSLRIHRMQKTFDSIYSYRPKQ